MKKNLIIVIMSVIFAFVSCTKDQDIAADRSEAVTFSIQTEPLITTRAAAPAVTGKDARYIIELWDADNTARVERIVQLNNPSFSLILDKALSYNVAVWVDYVNDVDDGTGTPTDFYYATEDFKRIALNAIDGTTGPYSERVYLMSNLPARDAFTGVFPFLTGQPYPTTLQVKRPFARVNVIASDAGLWKNRSEINGDTIKVSFTNAGYYTYNILTQLPVSTSLNVGFTNSIPASVYNTYPDGVNQTVLSGLYFANPTLDGYSAHSKIFTIITKVGNGANRVDSIPNLPFKRNFNTNITGGLVFTTAPFSIDTNTEYDDPDIDTTL